MLRHDKQFDCFLVGLRTPDAARAAARMAIPWLSSHGREPRHVPLSIRIVRQFRHDYTMQACSKKSRPLDKLDKLEAVDAVHNKISKVTIGMRQDYELF